MASYSDDEDLDEMFDWHDYLVDEEEDNEKDQPQLNTDVSMYIVVDNLPVVGKDKYEKLLGLVRSMFDKFNRGFSGDVWMPMAGEPPKSKGYAFVQMRDAASSKQAIEKGNGFKLDKEHVLAVNSLSDFQKFASMPAEYKEPTVPEFQKTENLLSFTLDDRGREQFLIRHADLTTINYYDSVKSPELVMERKVTDGPVFWSPQGSFLVSFHQQGLIVWGGPKFEKLRRFAHAGVVQIDFSPCERFMVTSNKSAGDESIIVWDLRTGQKLRTFPSIGSDEWPALRWSFDGSYFARLHEETILVYEASSMTLLDGKGIRVAGIRDFAWSPADSLLAHWIPEVNESPARVTIVQIPTRRDVGHKNLFNVAECKMYWHPDGRYLCVRAERHTKNKKSTYTNFELFRVKEKDVPVDLLEFKDKVISFAWEPKGTRFGVVHGDGVRPDVSFYNMEAPVKGIKSKLSLICSLPKRSANTIIWAPRGRVCVLAGMGQLSGSLEFYSVDDQLTLGEGEHFMCTNVEWDPSGRYVTTFVNYRRNAAESSYCVWSWTGVMRERVMLEKISQFMWRPYPRPLLTTQQQEEVLKTLKQREERYSREDAALLLSQDQTFSEERKRKRDNWTRYRAERAADAAAVLEARKRVLNQKLVTISDVTEEVLAETSEIVPVDDDDIADFD